MNKTFLYIKQICRLAVGNKMRFILTLIGITVGLFVFSTGNMIVNGYYESMLSEINEMPENSLYVYSDDEEIIPEMMRASDLTPTAEYISSDTHIIYQEENMEDETVTTYNARIHGMSSMDGTAVVYDSIYGLNMTETKLVEGRLLTAKEIADNERVCVIDEYTANHVFNGKNAIGNYIFFGEYENVESVENANETESDTDVLAYMVVGVVKDSYYMRKWIENAENQKKDGSDNIQLFVNIYCPYNYYENINVYGEITNVFLWNTNDSVQRGIVTRNLKQKISSISNRFMISDIISRESEYENAEFTLRPVREILRFVVAALMLITGIFNMSILFFAMKERVEEIGIKKAFGASAADIVFQFIMENMMIIIIGICISLFLSILSVMATAPYIRSSIFSDYNYVISAKDILSTVATGILEGMIFTVIPSIRYSCMSTTEALRADC